jgi:hypothetical protein
VWKNRGDAIGHEIDLLATSRPNISASNILATSKFGMDEKDLIVLNAICGRFRLKE